MNEPEGYDADWIPLSGAPIRHLPKAKVHSEKSITALTNLTNTTIPAYDPKNLILYVSIHQLFRIWLLPFFSAHVSLVTVLHLVPQNHTTNTSSPTTTTYLIKSQNDLYQVNEFVKFASQFGILSVVVYAWQLLATLFCVLGAGLFWPVSWVEQNVVGGNEQRSLVDVVKG